MPKYCTWDDKRDRWVFQLRVPDNLREHFRGVTVIREHIGRVDDAVAAAHAQRRAAELREQFDRLLGSLRGPSGGIVPRPPLVRFTLGQGLLARLVATWQMHECDRFRDTLRALRQADDDAWQALAQRLDDQHAGAIEAFRRADAGPLDTAIAAIEQWLNIRLSLDPVDQEEVIDAFNGARAALIGRFRRVASGEDQLETIQPRPDETLPLVELWGDRAGVLSERWREERLALGEPVKARTLDKYTKITTDLATVLGRRPVQSLLEADLAALAATWRENGNGPDTIDGKLEILKGLLRPFVEPTRLQALFRRPTRRSRQRKAKRLPFSEVLLVRYLAILEQAPAISVDDLRCVQLLALTGAHLEELYQLRGDDLQQTDYGWVVRIAEGQSTGTGDATLKTDDCARHLPVCVADDVFPGLSAWIKARVDADGFLFASASQNKYGVRSAAISQRLNRMLRQVVPHERRLVLQSLRNTVGRVLRRGHVDARVRRRFLGHADVDIHDLHYDPAILLDDSDLLPAAEAIVRWLRVECLGATKPHGHGDS